MNIDQFPVLNKKKIIIIVRNVNLASTRNYNHDDIIRNYCIQGAAAPKRARGPPVFISYKVNNQ